MRVVGLNASQVSSEKYSKSIKMSNAMENADLSFKAKKANENEEGKGEKKVFSFKKLTNILGTVAGIGIITGSAIYMKRRPQWMKILNKEHGELDKKIANAIERAERAIRIGEGKEKKGNFWYRSGAWIQEKVERIGDELSNNLLYGIGTCCIMPLVLAFSPIGKKNSTKEDKFFAIVRQPISFATMFSIQLTNDKMFSRWSKNIIGQNILESDEIVKKKDNR